MTKPIVIAVALLAMVSLIASQPPGEFPIAEKQYKNSRQFFYLHTDYGFVVKWDHANKGSYFLYDRARSNIFTTTNLASFLDGLGKIPNGSTLSWVNTCGAPLHYGMPSELLSKIENVIKERKFKMAGVDENNFILCTCEATNLWFFTKPLVTSTNSAAR